MHQSSSHNHPNPNGAWSHQSLQSTLPLQILLYFHPYYWFLYYVVVVVLLIYKAVVFPYPRDILGAEATTLSFLGLIDLGRIMLGHKGNLTQARLPLLLFVVLSAPVILGHIFFLQFQTYVMRLDAIMNVIALIFVCGEVLLAFFIVFAVLSLRLC